MMPSYPVNAVEALDGRDFATLNHAERETLGFYWKQGRKYNVRISIISNAERELLASAMSMAEAERILERAGSRVTVSVGQEAGSQA